MVLFIMCGIGLGRAAVLRCRGMAMDQPWKYIRDKNVSSSIHGEDDTVTFEKLVSGVWSIGNA